ncbi:MAG: penicillin-insensitive murein endopeptidase [Deltaproteobacteria bacterium]|nr:penicillin-insensitive murein endopeptidase [Deltaproteobacteria bacterium]
MVISRACLSLAAATLLAGATAFADPPAGTSTAAASVSLGTPMDGRLERGVALPARGAGFRLLSEARARKARFGAAELVGLVEEAAAAVVRRHPGSVLTVGDLSARKGGRIDHHGSHRSGRDVDLLFYLTNRAGKPVVSPGFVPVDGNGVSVTPPLKYAFDAGRNWTLVAALLSSKRADVQFIFVADHVRAMLLAAADKARAPRWLVARAEQVLRQPGRKAHWDHFHVRILCPGDDRPECRDVGPLWSWAK